MKPDIEIEALKALVGAAAVNATDALADADAAEVGPDSCAGTAARALWGCIDARLRSGQRLDAVAIRTQLPDVPPELVLSVLTEKPLGVAAERYRILRDVTRRRQYMEALRNVARLVRDESQSLDAAVSEGRALLDAWAGQGAKVTALDSSVFNLVDDLEAVQAGRRNTTVPTGWSGWDEILGGLQPTLTVVGALPGVGKSALVAGILRALAMRGVTTGLVSLEDEREWLTRRVMALAAQVPLFVLANRPLGAKQLERVGEAAPKVHALLAKVLCDDRSGLTPAEVVASARTMVAQGAAALIVDHLGEVRLERTDRHDLDIAEALAELRRLAKTTRVPVVVLSHLRRRDGLDVDKEPRLTDFAFSAAVERMARVALGLWKGDKGELLCTILKQTQGVAGKTFVLDLHADSGVVTDVPSTEGTRNLYGGTNE